MTIESRLSGKTAFVAALEAKYPGRTAGLRCDVSDFEQIKLAVAGTVERFGALDPAVNSAGIAGAPGLSHETGGKNWRQARSN